MNAAHPSNIFLRCLAVGFLKPCFMAFLSSFSSGPCVKLPAHSAGLPGNDLLFKLCPLTPPIPLGRDGARSGQSATIMRHPARSLDGAPRPSPWPYTPTPVGRHPGFYRRMPYCRDERETNLPLISRMWTKIPFKDSRTPK